MRYVIAAASERIIQACRSALGGVPGIEFRVGTVPETWTGCDAIVMWWPLAHDRYGGIPEPGVAQVLFNARGDDIPEIVLATPSGPGMTSGVGSSEAEIEDYSFYALDACIREYLHQFPDCGEEAKILVHLEAAGLDRTDMSASLRGISKALTQGHHG